MININIICDVSNLLKNLSAMSNESSFDTELSPFSAGATSPGEQKKEIDGGALNDELLVDISDIRPAGHNKDLFSIDEDSQEGSPSKSGFQLVDLSEAETVTPSDTGGGTGPGQGVAGVTFDPTVVVNSSPTHRLRRDSVSSSVSDVSSLFPIYEVPGVTFNMPQSDMESSSEWEESSNGAVVDRLSKDTVYQAYLKIRQRYHKYKGRYADLARAFKEKEKESEKLRDVLTKTQDKALRKVSELKEQCALEQQAKAHLEQELRSDLEEKDHKIMALQTKVKILQEGGVGDLISAIPRNDQDEHPTKVQDEVDNLLSGDNNSLMDNVSTTESASYADSISMTDNISMADNVSVASHGSASTAVTVNIENEELIEKLKADVAKHKSLLARCMDNIRGNKERIGVLTQERDVATAHLQEKIKQLDAIKNEHVIELESLRSSMESSALSMAETKKQLFEELQAKESEMERCKMATDALAKQLQDEQNKVKELQEKEIHLQDAGSSHSKEEVQESEHDTSVSAIKQEVETKIQLLESRVLELKESRTLLETELSDLRKVKEELEDRVERLSDEKESGGERLKEVENKNFELSEMVRTLENLKLEFEEKLENVENSNTKNNKRIIELENSNSDLEKKVKELQTKSDSFDGKITIDEEEFKSLKESNDKNIEKIQDDTKEIKDLKVLVENIKQDENKKQQERDTKIEELKANVIVMEDKLKNKESALEEAKSKVIVYEEKLKGLNDILINVQKEKDFVSKNLKEKTQELEASKELHSQEVSSLKMQKEKVLKDWEDSKSSKEEANDILVAIQKEKAAMQENIEKLTSEMSVLKNEKDQLNSENEVLKSSNNEMNAEFGVLKSEMDALIVEKKELKSERVKLISEKDQLHSEIQTWKSEKEELNTEFSALKSNMDILIGEKETLKSDNEKLDSLNEILRAEKDKFASETDVIKAEREELNSEYSALKLERDNLSLEKDKINTKNKALKLEKDKLNLENESLKSEKDKLNSENESLKSEKDKLISQNESLNSEKDKLNIENESLKSEKDKLISQNESLKSYKDKLNIENESLKSEKDKWNSENESLKSEKEKLNAAIHEHISVKDQLNKENKALKLENTKLKVELQTSKDSAINLNQQALGELSQVTEKMDTLNRDWANQMKEKNTINEELTKKVSELEVSLKQKTEEYLKKMEDSKVKIEKLNSELQLNKTSIGKYKKTIDDLNSLVKQKEEKNSEVTKAVNDLEKALENKNGEVKVLKEHISKNQKELGARVTELESDVNNREVELTASLEEKKKYLSLLKKIKQEKMKIQEDLEVAKKEVEASKKISHNSKTEVEEFRTQVSELKDENKNLKEETVKSEEKMRKLEETNTRLQEMLSSKCDEYDKARLEVQQVSKSAESEVLKLKETLTKLKDSYQNFTKEKESLHEENVLKNNRITELEATVKQREEKIEKLLYEKKTMLTELEKKIELLQKNLEEKEKSMKTIIAEYEEKLENEESKLKASEDDMKKQVENALSKKHTLEQRVKDLSHELLVKDEIIVKQAAESEKNLRSAQEEFNFKVTEMEGTWKERLRSHGFADSLIANNRYVALFNMLKITCELEKIQRVSDEKLASVSLELNNSQQSQLEGVKSSYERTISSRDATIASLKDETDQLRLSQQEAIDKLNIQLDELSYKYHSQVEKSRNLEKTMEETTNELAASESRCEELEKKIKDTSTTPESPTAQIEALTNENQQLKTTLSDLEKEKEETTKKIAMLEFNNDHNKSKVQNMELSNEDLLSKIESLKKENENLFERMKEGSSGYEEQLLKEKEEFEQNLTKQKEELEQKFEAQTKYLRDQVEGLTDIKLGFEKQIGQIEDNNAEMHRKIGGVQEQRDLAKKEVATLKKQNDDLQKQIEDFTKIKKELDDKVSELKGTISNFEEKLDSEENEIQSSKETIHTLNNNILNLQKQIEGLNETNSKLAKDLQTESKIRIDTQEHLSKLKQMYKQMEESHTGDSSILNQIRKEKEEQLIRIQALMEEKRMSDQRFQDQKSLILGLERDNRNMSEKLGSTLQTSNTNGLVTNDTKSSDLSQSSSEEVTRLKSVINDLQEKLRLAEIVSGEVDEHRKKVRELETKLVQVGEEYRHQLKTVTLEAEQKVAVKELECQQAIASAFDQQDNQTSVLVQQQKDVLLDAQNKAKEKAAQLETVVNEYQGKLKYEEQLADLNKRHESHMKEVESTWKARADKMVKQRETQLQEEMDRLVQNWNKERKELERLTKVAAAAFRSGTDSVELLKEQVANQRKEIEDVKLNHSKEIGELKALLELKRRSRGGGGGGGVRLGVSLEEAAEFEYLKNILYQYMLGKETQTLSKVLCAVVKFDGQQQQEILEHEEQRQSLQHNATNGFIHPEPLNPQESEGIKTLENASYKAGLKV